MNCSEPGIYKVLQRDPINVPTMKELETLAIEQLYLMLELAKDDKLKLKVIELTVKLIMTNNKLNVNVFDTQIDTNNIIIG